MTTLAGRGATSRRSVAMNPLEISMSVLSTALPAAPSCARTSRPQLSDHGHEPPERDEDTGALEPERRRGAARDA